MVEVVMMYLEDFGFDDIVVSCWFGLVFVYLYF